MKKNIIALICAVVILALLGGGYYFAVKWEPEKKEAESVSSMEEETVYLIDEERDNVKSVHFHNGNIDYTLINGEKISITGYESLLISDEALENAFSSAIIIGASHTVGEDEDPEKFGLSEKNQYVSVLLNDGSEKTIIIGNATNFEGEYYASVEGEKTVYTIAEYKLSSLLENPENYRKTDICSIDNTTISELTVKKGSNTVVSIVAEENKNKDKEQDKNNPYGQMKALKMLAPYKMPASADKFSQIAEKITPMSAEKITEEQPEDLSKYGLLEPYSLIVRDSAGNHELKLGKKTGEGTVYLMYNDLNVVFEAVCPFYDDIVNINPEDFADRFIHLVNISDIKDIKIKTAKGEYDLNIKGDVNKEKDAKFSINGKTISEENFKKLYQQIIGITFSDMAPDEKKGEEICEIAFNSKDGRTKSYKYYVYDERNSFVVSQNGIPCLVLTKNLELFEKTIEELIK